jgi:hypothetical protein
VIEKLASAIASREGFWAAGDPLPRRINNPGDLVQAPWLPARARASGKVHFESLPEGIAGLYHQIALDIARGKTLRQLINKWAPPPQNDPTTYLAEVVKLTGLDPDVKLWEYLEIHKPD